MYMAGQNKIRQVYRSLRGPRLRQWPYVVKSLKTVSLYHAETGWEKEKKKETRKGMVAVLWDDDADDDDDEEEEEEEEEAALEEKKKGKKDEEETLTSSFGLLGKNKTQHWAGVISSVIEDGMLMFDKTTNRHRGTGLTPCLLVPVFTQSSHEQHKVNNEVLCSHYLRLGGSLGLCYRRVNNEVLCSHYLRLGGSLGLCYRRVNDEVLCSHYLRLGGSLGLCYCRVNNEVLCSHYLRLGGSLGLLL
ncbi:hypothetical protein RRG08_033461 [Elysia crispata]|uniref:Uncharacterized protein n=1 Tax=Elysia crispata TaxID=231223 RepID=A0AAE1ATU1_9GAST|nr:hypothetical protein RRG08_033461 [Elysia crispata]